MSRELKYLMDQLRHCALSDNSVDYLEDELELQEKYGWLDKEVIEKRIPDLITLSKELGDIMNSPADKLNEWDVQYDELCREIIGQLERKYQNYVKNCLDQGKDYIKFEVWANMYSPIKKI